MSDFWFPSIHWEQIGITPKLYIYIYIDNIYIGKGLLSEENRLFLGPCIDHLGSLVIIRGGGILYYTTGKFTQKPELHQRQNNSKKIIENFTILLLEINNATSKNGI